MKNKTIIRLFTAALAVALCATAFAVPAFAGGGEGEPYYTEMEADLTENDGTPEITVSDDEDTAGGDNAEAGGDTLDQLTELLGSLGTVTVTEDGILFTPNLEGLEPLRTGTVTTCGGNLNVRTGAGLDNDAFTQLPNGAQVEVIGTEGEWVKVLLPEREGYVHSDYLTITDTGSFSLS
ncbi:MAG TPA: SH3 domain-containing protein, partial [Candidatus Avoscillospira stercoripullorum]|nr:SH3 domain-containing protein [Candidatus Avoscillospira stercoripullorum]